MQYTYYARDYFNNCGDYSLSGEHYDVLLQHCFKYSDYLSLVISDCDIPLLKKLEKWVVKNPSIAHVNLSHQSYRRVYYACEEVYSIILTMVNNLFDFCCTSERKYPEDPVFLRKDGTVFLDSVIHEGECSIYPRNIENVENVLKYGHWLPINEDGIPEAPAIEHQLVPPYRDDVVTNSLYITLLEIRKCPEHYLDAQTAEELDKFISSYRPENCRNIPLSASLLISFTPHWYRAFEFYVLGECKAMTTTKLSAAFNQAGYSGIEGYNKFFELLDFYLQNICRN